MFVPKIYKTWQKFPQLIRGYKQTVPIIATWCTTIHINLNMYDIYTINILLTYCLEALTVKAGLTEK